MVAFYIAWLKPNVIDEYGLSHYYAWIGLTGMVVVDLIIYLLCFRPLVNLIFSN